MADGIEAAGRLPGGPSEFRKRVAVECARCGKKFDRPPSATVRKDRSRPPIQYCSRSCQWKGVERTCTYCSKSFERRRSAVSRDGRPGLYCSQDCYYLARRNGESRPCWVCGELFNVTAGMLTHSGGGGRFACSPCKARWSGKSIELICQDCETTFERKFIYACRREAVAARCNPCLLRGRQGRVAQPPCKSCGGEILTVPGNRIARYCSRACYRKSGNTSSLELKAHEVLSRFGVTFETEAAVGPWVVDFYIPADRLVLEMNGCFWHACRPCYGKETLKGQRARDSRRANWLAANGYRLVTIWEHSFRSGEAEVMLEQAIAG